VEHVARMGEMRNAYKILVGKPEGEGSFQRPRRRWKLLRWISEDVSCEDVDRIQLAQDRVQWTVGVITVTSLLVS
jgi:hypothetical protein